MTDSFFHNQVWKRFMRLPYGHIVDYTDGEGTVFFPTAEDCKRSVPNAFGAVDAHHQRCYVFGAVLIGIDPEIYS